MLRNMLQMVPNRFCLFADNLCALDLMELVSRYNALNAI